MRELTKSITSFSWALSLFGARQMLNLMDPDRAGRAFDSVARATEGQLDDGLRNAYRMGDRLQRSMVDATFSLMGQGGLDPSAWAGAARRAADRTAEALGGSGCRDEAAGMEGSGGETGWGPMPGASPGNPPSAAPGATSSGDGGEGWGPMDVRV